jgi:hypothetical protein
MIGYFARLSGPKLVLWCYLAWYVSIVACYFDPAPLLWLSSLGIAALIGIGLNFATRVPGQGMERWVVFRLFMFPFCVSSYSALIKGKGFILLFPTERGPLLVGVTACAGMVGWRFLCRVLVREREAG